MSTKLERNLEPFGDQHIALLAAAALQGVDTTPTVGGAQRFIGYGDSKLGYGPVCILDLIQTDYVAEPHIVWLPWVRSAEMLGHFRWAMNYLSKSREVLLNVEKKHVPFFEHFVKKGLLRKIGYIENLPIVEEIHMYQVKRSTP